VVLQTGAFIDAHFWVILRARRRSRPRRLHAGRSGSPRCGPQRRRRVDAIARWLRRIEIARWLRLMANLTAGKLRLAQCLDAAIGALSLNGVKRERSASAGRSRQARRSRRRSRPRVAVRPTTSRLLRAGERAGSSPSSSASWRPRGARGGERVRRFVALLEPAAILVIGALIGTLMVGIMLAVTSLSSVAV